MHISNRLIKYFKFYIGAKGLRGYGIHSPFVFNLVTQIIRKNKSELFYKKIEKHRKGLLKNKSVIQITEMGSGSCKYSGKQRSIKNIAAHSLKPKRQAQLLSRLVGHFQYSHIIEIGTSLGITTCYLAQVNPKCQVITLEGCPEISKIAQTTFDSLQVKNVQLMTGEFKQTLNKAIEGMDRLDFVFFDGNHRYEPTLDYFNICLNKKHNNTLFVFDDIHHSLEMEKAWEDITTHPEVKATIDLYFMGLVFFKKELTKQHFKIRF